MLRSFVILPSLIVGFAIPALAQESPRKAVEAFFGKYNDTILKKDAAGLAAMYTQDGIEVTPQGPVAGREALQKLFTGALKPVIDHAAKVDQVGAVSDAPLWATGSWSATIESSNGPMKISGFWGATFTRDVGDLRMTTLTYNMTPASAPQEATK